MKFKPTDKFYIVKNGKIQQAIITEVTDRLGMPTKSNKKDYKVSNKIYYAVKSRFQDDGKTIFSRHLLEKNDNIFKSHLKALRFLKENIVYLHDSDVKDLISEERELSELPF